MPPIVPVGLDEPPTDSDNEFYSEDELPNYVFQDDMVESDSSVSPGEEEQEPQVNYRYEVAYAYELLPQDPESSRNITSIDTDNTITHGQELEVDAIDDELPSGETVIPPPMDEDQIEKIKAVMLNVTLPTSAIPSWATNLPEDSWKDHLISRIQAKKDI